MIEYSAGLAANAYSATIETETRRLRIDAAMDALSAYAPSISHSPQGWATATITVHATSLAQATAAACAVVSAALGADAIAAHVHRAGRA